MQSGPLFTLNLSSLTEQQSPLTITLPYDPDSPYTWIDPEHAQKLALPNFREKHLQLPDSEEVIRTHTIIALLTCGALQGVDELILAPRNGLARLGFRSLFAIQARIVKLSTNSSSPRFDEEYIPNNHILVPVQALEPYSNFNDRGWPRGGVPEQFLRQLDRGMLTRSALAIRYFVLSLTHEQGASIDSIAHALYRLLSRFLECPRVAVMTKSSRADQWHICTKTPSLKTDVILDAVSSNPNGESVPRSQPNALCWVFPTDRRVFAFVKASSIACYIEPRSPSQYYFLQRMFLPLSSILDLLLLQADVIQALWSTRNDARDLLSYPSNREKVVSYRLLNQARSVLRDWTRLSFWRTSRTLDSLEKTAEHQPQHADFQPDRIIDWQDMDRHDGQPGIPSEKYHDNPALVAIATPHTDNVPSSKLDILRRLLGVRDPLQTQCETQTHALFDVFLSLDRQTAKRSDDETGPTRFAKMEANVQKLLNSLSLSGSELVVLLWSHLPAAHGPGPILPEGFHLVITLMTGTADLTRIQASSLAALRRALSLSMQHYNALSWERYRLRVISDFLTGIYTAPDLPKLGKKLEEILSSLLHTSMFVVIERRSGKVILASDHLQQWIGRALPPFEVSEAVPRWYRDIAGASGPLAESLRPSQTDRGVPMKAGGVFSAISDSLAILVMKFGKDGWQPTSTDYSCVRVLSAALQLAKPFGDYVSHHSPQPLEWSEGLSQSLMTKQTNVPVILNQLLGKLKHDLGKLHSGLERCAAMLLGVDGQLLFCRPIAGGASSDVVPLEDSSMVGYSLTKFRETEQPFTCILGVLNSGGNTVSLLASDGTLIGTTVTFHRLIPANPGDVVAVKGFTRSNRLPLGFLVVSIGSKTFLDTSERLNQAHTLIEEASAQAALLLQRQIDLRTSEMRLAMEAPLRRLKNPKKSILTTLSEVRSEDQKATGHLPSPLRRIFTAEYCTSLQEILVTALRGTQVFSVTCRIRYPGLDGVDRIWKLASAGNTEGREFYEYSTGANVHSYLCQDNGTPASDDFAEEQLRCVFLPDVLKADLNGKLYPGLRYLNVHKDTKTELCFGFAFRGLETYHVTINIEGPSFFDLWLVEEFFRQMAATIASEVALHCRRAEAADQRMMELATLIAGSMKHTIAREMTQSFTATGLKAVSLEMEIADGLEGKGTSRSSITQILSEGIASFTELRPNSTVVLWPAHSIMANLLEPEPAIPEVFSRLLTKLLLEQAETLNRIAVTSTKIAFLICWRRSPDKHHVIIDIFNNVAPKTEECRRLADALFWYKIDNDGREAKGRSGRGLYLLGHMLRTIGCRPCARPQPPSTTLAAYPDELSQRIRSEMQGFAIELRFPVSNV